jgi:hypothetical protein
MTRSWGYVAAAVMLVKGITVGGAGWYTARWIDRLLFPANGPSATLVVPELQGLAVGDFVPDGPPETKTGFIVEELVSNEVLGCTPLAIFR